MKIRLIPQKYIKNAYKKKTLSNKVDIKEELNMENIEKVPKELFQILGETLTFIDSINNMEGKKDEDK